MLFTLQFKICALSSRGGALPPPCVPPWYENICVWLVMHFRLLPSYTFRPHVRPFNWSATRPYTGGGGLNFVLCARAELFIWNFTYVKFCNQTPFFGVFSLKWKIKILRLRGLHFLLTKLPQRNSVFSTNSKFDNWSCKPKSNRIHGLKYLRSPIHWVAKIKGLENQC